MAKSEERNLNVTIKNQEDNDNEVVLSLSGIMKKFKKYFLPWIMVAAILAVFVLGVTSVMTISNKPPLEALISFTYTGVEKGLDPNGRTFDKDTLKSPGVIEAAVTSLGIDIEKVEDIRQNIVIEGIIPTNIIDKITEYRSLISQASNPNLTAVQELLETKYYPTKYKINFNYGATGLDKDKSVQLLNAMLDEYRNYFYEKYGYNKALGTSISNIDYSDYDYVEAVDLFRTNINSLKRYLSELAKDDSARFLSSTGYTFTDLYQTLNTIEAIDLDKITSYVTTNNLTTDKEASLAYINYRIENLNRRKDELTECIEAIKAATESYQKDVLLVMQTDGKNTEVSQGSDKYDSLVQQNVNRVADLADVKKDIAFYESRRDALEKAPTGTEEMKNKVEAQLAKLDTKLKDLVEITKETSDEYFETVEFAHAYNVLVPAVNSKTAGISAIIKKSIMPVVIVELFLFVIYAAVVFVSAIKAENSKKELCVADGCDDEDDSDDEKPEAKDEEPEEEAPKKSSENKQKSKK